MILRQLIVALRLKTFKQDFTKAEGAINKVKTAATAMAAVMIAGIAFRGLVSVVEDGSRAEETLNVLKQTFQEFTPEVLAWSGTTAKAMGRSEFAVREYATSLQALLAPMTQNRKEAAKMAMALTERGIDLGSLWNIDPARALRAIRSGLSGEVEPLRNAFGIDLTVDALAEFSGMSKKAVTGLKGLAKAQLRMSFIMARSKDAEGDAARTADGYANTMERLRGAFKDLRTVVGNALLPDFSGAAGMLADVVTWLKEVLEQTTYVEAAFMTLKIVLGVLAIAFIAAFWSPLLVILAIGLAIFAVIAIVEEVMAFFDDEVDGYLEGLFNDIPEALGVLADIFASIVKVSLDYLKGLFTDTLLLIYGVIDSIKDAASRGASAVAEFFGMGGDDDEKPKPGARNGRFLDGMSPFERKLAGIESGPNAGFSPEDQFRANVPAAVAQAQRDREAFPGGRPEPTLDGPGGGAPVFNVTIQGNMDEGAVAPFNRALSDAAAQVPVRKP